jgi:hypothetical protein
MKRLFAAIGIVCTLLAGAAAVFFLFVPWKGVG